MMAGAMRQVGMRLLPLLVAGLLLAAALGGCGCRSSYVGEDGAIHPGHCFIG